MCGAKLIHSKHFVVQKPNLAQYVCSLRKRSDNYCFFFSFHFFVKLVNQNNENLHVTVVNQCQILFLNNRIDIDREKMYKCFYFNVMKRQLFSFYLSKLLLYDYIQYAILITKITTKYFFFYMPFSILKAFNKIKKKTIDLPWIRLYLFSSARKRNYEDFCIFLFLQTRT